MNICKKHIKSLGSNNQSCPFCDYEDEIETLRGGLDLLEQSRHLLQLKIDQLNKMCAELHAQLD